MDWRHDDGLSDVEHDELSKVEPHLLAVAIRAVGWADPDYAGRLFRRSIGFTARQYRTLGKRAPAEDRAGGFPR
ncbi:hypothetical protein [Phytohabitans suffuscus]|uniref:HTH araC/xylS-type domain-containing protein n=1 Tax=Phytohabitans suffuscus TaxID=624315 RepID=A0A6F8YCF1_9ACTN|nr:hypothetical protein [Phytohabitans suffuscus]BCB83737.1 hypothetical protein Psuf_010500 [Phytohabitans suffuscus]